MALIGSDAHLERIHPDDRERYRAALAKARRRGGRYEVEYRMQDAAGTLLHLRETAEQVAHDTGARLVGCVQDLGEAKRIEAMVEARVAERTAELRRAKEAAEAAERAARASNERFVVAAEALMDGLAIFDADDRLVYHNRRYPQHATRPFGEALKIGMRFSEIVEAAVAAGAVYHPDMGEDFARRRLAQHRPAAHEQEFRIADGRWVRVRESAIEGGGRVLLTSDITAQRAATNALEEREHRLRTIADGVPLPIVIARINQPEILFVNELGGRDVRPAGRPPAGSDPGGLCGSGGSQAAARARASGRPRRGLSGAAAARRRQHHVGADVRPRSSRSPASRRC